MGLTWPVPFLMLFSQIWYRYSWKLGPDHLYRCWKGMALQIITVYIYCICWNLGKGTIIAVHVQISTKLNRRKQTPTDTSDPLVEFWRKTTHVSSRGDLKYSFLFGLVLWTNQKQTVPTWSRDLVVLSLHIIFFFNKGMVCTISQVSFTFSW